ncbi:phage holin family protein [Lacticaseibacillus jixianensis]|uniref:Phage holin family protein n=1 Tax=Lacticaseibacillus jixianensis TaxID=2486012 RepID=A0ABW4B7F0_9LACO|nr:phage holin family protein [Lacticaseibacillus jixianensis]
MGFIRKVLLTTGLFLVYAELFPGQLYVADWQTALTGAVILGVLNGLLKPVLKLLTFPLTILTLGLSLLILNALMVSLMTQVVAGISFFTFGSELVFALLVSVVNATLGEPHQRR